MSATSPPSALGQCVVCGKESTTACSVCKKAGLDWMFFCSRDHQRLIWKSHKLACGKNPFEYPPFSAKEVEQMWEARNDPSYPSPSLSDTVRRVTEGMLKEKRPAEDVALSNDQMDAFLQKHLMALGTEDPRGLGRQNALRIFRAIVFGSKLMKLEDPDKGLPSNETRLYLREDPLAFMAFIEQDVTDQISNSSWYPNFQHRLFIFIGTEAADDLAQYGHPDLALPWSLDRVRHFSKEYTPRIDFESARFLNETINPRLLDVLGIAVFDKGQSA